MRIIDLILLLSDFNRDKRVFVEVDKQKTAVVDLEAKDDGIYLKVSDKLRGIKNWEFILLMNQKEYYELPLYYGDKKNHHQLFGFRVADDCILLG